MTSSWFFYFIWRLGIVDMYSLMKHFFKWSTKPHKISRHFEYRSQGIPASALDVFDTCEFYIIVMVRSSRNNSINEIARVWPHCVCNVISSSLLHANMYFMYAISWNLHPDTCNNQALNILYCYNQFACLFNFDRSICSSAVSTGLWNGLVMSRRQATTALNGDNGSHMGVSLVWCFAF